MKKVCGDCRFWGIAEWNGDPPYHDLIGKIKKDIGRCSAPVPIWNEYAGLVSPPIWKNEDYPTTCESFILIEEDDEMRQDG